MSKLPPSSHESPAVLAAIQRVGQRYGHFAAEQVSAVVGLPVSVLQDILRSSPFVEQVQADGPLRWRLQPEHAAELSHALNRAGARRVDDDDAELDLAGLLQDSLDALEVEWASLDADRYERRVAMTQRYLQGLDTERWAEQVARYRQLDRARQQLQQFRADLRPHLERTRSVRPSTTSNPVHRSIRAALFDWSVSLPLRSLALAHTRRWSSVSLSDPMAAAEKIFVGVASAPNEDLEVVLEPAARAIWLGGQDNAELRKALLETAKQVIRIPRSYRVVASAAILAMTLDAPETADDLVRCILWLDGANDEADSPHELELCYAALSRLAKPGSTIIDRQRAASACAFLLPRSDEQRAVYLAPGALCAEGTEPSHVVERIGRVLFDSAHSRPAAQCAAVDMGALARTLSVSLFWRATYQPDLERTVSRLLQSLSGEALLKCLVDGRHSALRLRSANEAPFVILPAAGIYQAVEAHRSVRIDWPQSPTAKKALRDLTVGSGRPPAPLSSALSERRRPRPVEVLA